ncbi:MAG: hypothetical protein E7646_04495 [Ruminococcaceae bacterium]|nr:hypothetical protein [Oscillospiraceae bacterium]
MKHRFLALFLLVGILLLSSCQVQMEHIYPTPEEVEDKYISNKQLFFDAANRALVFEDDVFISTAEYYRPENYTELSGLYVSNVAETKVEALEDPVISALFERCDVRSMATRTEGGISACEFNCGGSGSYYCGVYYVSEDKPIFISNFSVTLEETKDGFSCESNGIRYFTQKLADNFYYFDAQI